MKRTAGIIFLLVAILSLTGCAHNTSGPVLNLDPPTCQEALSATRESVTDAEIAVILENAVIRDDMDSCWKPLMEKSIHQDRVIPHDHLKMGVRLFNQQQYLELYHKVLTRYFENLINYIRPYGAKERLLLETYASYIINNSKTASEKKLMDVKAICKRIDPDLYVKLFQ